MKTCYLILSLLLTLMGNLYAQPQAPITWGQMRVLSQGPTEPIGNTSAYKIYAKGDTILLGAWGTNSSGQELIFISVSANNGLTWSPWRYLSDSTGFSRIVQVFFTITRHGIYANGNVVTPEISTMGGLYCTTNLGQSWQSPLSVTPNLINFALFDTYEDTVLEGGSIVRWTNDGGRTHSPMYQTFTDTTLVASTGKVVTGNKHFFFNVALRAAAGYTYGYSLVFERRNYSGQRVGQILTFNNGITYNIGGKALFDDEGNGVFLAVTDTTNPIGDYVALHRWISHDEGVNWSQRQTLTPTQSVSGQWISSDAVLAAHHVSRWILCWQDTIRDAPYNVPPYITTYKILLSPNRCYSWLLPSQAGGSDTSRRCQFDYADIQGNRIRLYGISNRWNSRYQCTFWQIEGVIHPDTIAPVISSADTLSSTLSPNQTVFFRACASDNDTIFFVDCIVKRQGANDSVKISLSNRDSVGNYFAGWTTPQDTGIYRYYYRALDRWDNPGYYPANAPLQPFTFRIPGNTSTKEPALLPTKIKFSAFPNPGNATFTIVGTLPNIRPAILTIYDLQGRKIFCCSLFSSTIHQSFRYIWEGRDQRGVPVATGVYYCRMSGNANAIKIAVLR